MNDRTDKNAITARTERAKRIADDLGGVAATARHRSSSSPQIYVGWRKTMVELHIEAEDDVTADSIVERLRDLVILWDCTRVHRQE